MSYSTTGNPEVANLFRQAQAGDASSLGQLMDRHDGLVHHILRRQWCDSLSYTEVLQEGRIGLWRAILGFDPERGVAFSTYASLAIARRIWRAVAVRQAEREKQKPIWDWEGQPSPFPGSLTYLLAQEVQEALHTQVDQLPAQQRWLVQAYYGLDGQGSQTMTELGRQLGCSRQAIGYHLRRALLRLRHPAFSARLRGLLGRDRRQDYLQALQPGRRRS